MVADLRLREALDELLDLLLLGRVDIEFDARVEVFDVLADDDEVDVATRCRYPGIGLGRPEIRVEVKLLSQRDIHGAKAGAELGRERSLERYTVAPHGVERVLRERRAVILHRGHADV